MSVTGNRRVRVRRNCVPPLAIQTRGSGVRVCRGRAFANQRHERRQSVVRSQQRDLSQVHPFVPDDEAERVEEGLLAVREPHR